MTIDEAIELLKTERMCVRHADVCDRNCDKCVLVQDTDELLEMYDSVRDWLEQLKEYQQLEEQGRLIKLPCKVGDTVWDIDFGFPTPCCISAFSLGECEDYIDDPISGKEIVFYHSGRFTGSFLMSDIGKTVFLTKSEAEEKLKELKGDVRNG